MTPPTSLLVYSNGKLVVAKRRVSHYVLLDGTPIRWLVW